MTCPDCGHSARYHGDRERAVLGLTGEIRYRRAYYYCRRCGQGAAPFDDQAGLTSRGLTPGLERLATLAGAAAESFDRGAELLWEMAGGRLSESTVERTTEDVGQRIAAALDAGLLFGLAVAWPWYKDARGRTVGYLTLDATGTRQQGPNGAKAEGRMAYVAGVYNPYPDEYPRPPGRPPPCLQARYRGSRRRCGRRGRRCGGTSPTTRTGWRTGVPGGGLADRQRGGGERLQDRGRPTAQRCGYALG